MTSIQVAIICSFVCAVPIAIIWVYFIDQQMKYNLKNKTPREDVFCMHHGIKLNEDLQCPKCLEQSNK
jgi:hypothetical protein